MFVDDDSIISYRERKRERNNKVENESKSDDIKNFEKVIYRDERGRHNSIISIKSDKEYSVERNIIGCDKSKI